MAVKKTDTEENFPFNSKKARAITESYSRARDMHALPRFLQSTKTSRSLVVDSSYSVTSYALKTAWTHNSNRFPRTNYLIISRAHTLILKGREQSETGGAMLVSTILQSFFKTQLVFFYISKWEQLHSGA